MSDDLRTVATFATPIEADMARNRLEAAGVRAFLADDATVGWLWHLGTALQGIKVLVAESDLNRSIEILEAVGEPEPSEPPAEPWACPKCGTQITGEMDVCWACGTAADGTEDPEFESAAAPVLLPKAQRREEKGPPSPLLAALITLCIAPVAAITLLIPLAIFNAMVEIGTFEDPASVLPYAAIIVLFLVCVLFLACEMVIVVRFFHAMYYPIGATEEEKVAARAEALVETARSQEEPRDPELVLRIAVARRACLAALLGLGFCPPLLNFYSLWLILRYELHRREVLQEAGAFVYGAIALNALVCFLVMLLFLALGGLVRL